MASGKNPKTYPAPPKPVAGKVTQATAALVGGESVTISAHPAAVSAAVNSALDRGVDVIAFDTPNGSRAFNVSDF